ncbi:MULTISPECIES: type I glutamate--ammonia ligase [Brevibacterium]|uniref:Type I glutamine synthetase n=3 Tax=Brevibacterium casei TaxID=33889 RepID=K9B7B2_9MICO|nr:type I glutamate--ammonia ligase [Brevibacterium casei]NJE68480.1 type I glutamate--ammonia ligase [Brevibacterium sp. LS14]SIJ52228.1 glutamine synthetase [Mycobacteroides abscessus subsp. abscessus]EKU49670.1 type I glutamine synthetase [Brevibacterium casei S18]KZE16166.1 glutamine synthetase [Brevibacterium casei]MBE4693759.1 type I glutamate--ammonia ligase [Brevibacterium casei]
MSRQEEFVLRTVEDREVRFIRLWFTDVLGGLKSVAIVPAELEGAFSEGIGFDGSAVEGLSRVYEADMVLKPDPSTFSLLPWRGETEPTGRMFCDIHVPGGEPAKADPRNVLKRTLEAAAKKGFTFYVHPEIEFYLFRSGNLDSGNGTLGAPVPVDTAGYFDHVNGGTANDFRRSAVTMLEAMGLSVEFSHHEAGPGQNEIDLRYADALTMADNIMTFRSVIKEVAIAQGVYASFMPKPLSDHPGNGMHTHVSLFEGENNAFFEPGATYQLSKTGRQFIAGLLHHAAEITAVTNQYVNSYKRLWTGHEAPSYICWGHRNRSALVRVPQYNSGKSSSARVEYRGLDSSANPYLSYALMLAAGLKGIEEDYELPEEAEDNVWLLSDTERRAMGIRALPASLAEAVEIMEGSDLVAETLGEEVFDFFLRNKRQEWTEYRAQVTPYELSKHFSSM